METVLNSGIDKLKMLIEKPSIEQIAQTVCRYLHKQNDGISVRRENPHKVKGKYWRLMTSNDYPMQHGNGIDIFIEENQMIKFYELICAVGEKI
jgi:hypothetical protein